MKEENANSRYKYLQKDFKSFRISLVLYEGHIFLVLYEGLIIF